MRKLTAKTIAFFLSFVMVFGAAFSMLSWAAPDEAYADGDPVDEEEEELDPVDTYKWGDDQNYADQRSADIVYEYKGQRGKTTHKPYNVQKINWIDFKSGGYKGIRLLNRDEWLSGDELDDFSVEKIARNSMDNWVRLAVQIFDSESEHGGDHFSGTTWNGPMYDWGRYFKGNNEKKGEINLADWLMDFEKKKDPIKTTYVTTDWYVDHTGLQHAKSLSAVRDKMASLTVSLPHVRDKLTADRLLKQRTPDGALSAMKSPDETDVYYTIVAHDVHESVEWGCEFHNTYAVCLYGFSIEPVSAEGVFYPKKDERITSTEPGEKQRSWLVYNHTSTDGEQTDEFTIGDSEELMASTSKSSEYTWGGEFGGEFGVNFGTEKWPVKPSLKFNASGDWHKATTSGFEQSKSEITHGEQKQTIGIPLKAHTAKEVTQGDTKVTGYITYDCPMIVRYKVAIASIGGSVDGFNAVHTPVDFCTFFDGQVSGGGVDAVTNLSMRYKHRDTGDAYGKTEGYYKGGLLATGLDWDQYALKYGSTKLDGVTEDITTTIANTTKYAPMVSAGSRMDIEDHDYYQDAGEHMPLYKLAHIQLEDSVVKKEYKMTEGDVYPIDGLKVKGLNSYMVPYFGFDPELGEWKEVDKDGKAVPEDDQALEFIKNDVTGTVSIKARDLTDGAKTTYIMWELAEKNRDGDPLEYYSIEDKVTVSKTKNPPKYPFIQIDVNPKQYVSKIAFSEDAPKRAEAYAEEEFNLFAAFPCDVFDNSGNVVSHAVTYELNDKTLDPDKVKIDDDGNLIVNDNIPQEGVTYKIQASYNDNGNKKTTVDYATGDDPGTVEVLVNEKRYFQPQGKSTYGRIGPKDKSVTLELSSRLVMVDQYGEEWKGEVPKLSYELNDDSDEGATIKNGYFSARNTGMYIVDVKDANNDILCNIPIAIKKAEVATKPVAVEGLVYNGEEQTGVVESPEYTVTGNTATKAGTYKATVNVAQGYVWEDDSRDTLEIEWSIANKQVMKPAVTAELKYNGLEQTAVEDGEGYVVTGAKATEPGDYTARVALLDNYEWIDGTRDVLELKYKIVKEEEKKDDDKDKDKEDDKNKDDEKDDKKDPVAPEKPSVKAKADAKKKTIALSWKKVDGATGYTVSYRKTGAKSWTEKTTAGTKYTLKKLKKNGLYEYRVSAFSEANGKKASGAFSKAGKSYIAKVSKLKVKVSGKKARVTWKKYKNASGYQVVYSVRKDLSGAKVKTVKGGKKSAYTIKGLKKGKCYVAVRPYKTKSGAKYIGADGAKKTVKIK